MSNSQGDQAAEVGFHGLIYRPACAGCPLQGSKIVPPNGNLNARIAIVGENPGGNEERIGRGFVGRSGKLLDVLLERNGIDRADVWISNASLCCPRPALMQVPQPDGSISEVQLDQEQVKLNATRKCRPRLLAELARIRPRVIVPLGRLAFEAVTGEIDNITSRRGGVHTPDFNAAYIRALRDAASSKLIKIRPRLHKKSSPSRRAEKKTAVVRYEEAETGWTAILTCGHTVRTESRRKKKFACAECVPVDP